MQKLEEKKEHYNTKKEIMFSKDMIEIKSKIEQLEQDKKQIEFNLTESNLTETIQVAYERKRTSIKNDIQIIQNDLVEKKKNKKIARKKILGLFPDNR